MRGAYTINPNVTAIWNEFKMYYCVQCNSMQKYLMSICPHLPQPDYKNKRATPHSGSSVRSDNLKHNKARVQHTRNTAATDNVIGKLFDAKKDDNKSVRSSTSNISTYDD